MMVGNTLNEFINGINKPDAFKMSGEEIKSNVSELWKDNPMT